MQALNSIRNLLLDSIYDFDIKLDNGFLMPYEAQHQHNYLYHALVYQVFYAGIGLHKNSLSGSMSFFSMYGEET